MKRIRLFIRAFFGFSRMETNAFILLIPLMLVILFSEPAYTALTRDVQPFDPRRTDSLLAVLDRGGQKKNDTTTAALTLQPFDINNVSKDKLVAMQLSEKIASRVIGYRDKGGKFRKKEDMLRIYGMDSAWFNRVKSWMRVDAELGKGTSHVSFKQKRNKPHEDINTADSLQLMEVYGIGAVLARRILLFRERLGGFVSMEQLKEVYGLDSGVVKNISKRFEISTGFSPRMISINRIELNDLMQHPYVTRRQAQAIIAYRAQHVRFDSVGQLLEVRLLEHNWLSRIRPYLTVETDK